ncbi:MAG: leucyl aminopeptidase, partial [Azoarcus sp.]|nr:leucyl aminopeptidase [Azoarcus sp.]
MEFTIKVTPSEKLRTGLLILGAFADAPLPQASRAVDEAGQGRLSRLVSEGELGEKAGSTVLLHDLAGIAAERVLLVSFGKADTFGDKPWRDALAAIGVALSATVAKEAAIALDETTLPPGRNLDWALRQASRIVADAAYRFEPPRAEKKHKKKHAADKVAFILSETGETLEEAVQQGLAIAQGMALAKDLGNLGANVCTPAYLADIACDLGKQYKFEVDVLERDDMEKLGMGAFLAVARGARQSPRLIVMHYRGGKPHKGKSGKPKSHPVTLIGKGITFDSGGISLKPGAEMDEMKYDMCGAASVIGVFKAIAAMALPIDVTGIVPATENMPG